VEKRFLAGSTCPPGRPRKWSKKGSYATIGALSVPVVFGFGALAIDLAWLKAASLQAQDVADAATQAALIVLRETGDTAEAEEAAQEVVARNTIAGGEPELIDIHFGQWDEGTRAFQETDDSPNAVRASVGRRDASGVPFLLARIWGYQRADVIGRSTSAARALHVVLAIDITNSWDQNNFDYAREAALSFLDILTQAHGPDDRFGMVHFTGAYGIEYTPMRLVSAEAADGVARAKWAQMATASKSGRPDASNVRDRCMQHVNMNLWTAGPHGAGDGNATSHPAGGCFPGMFREYSDEPGTDHSIGLDMARTMLEEQVDDGAYRAVVMLTDGIPNGIAPGHGAIRQAQGYVDPLRYLVGARPHSTTAIENDSVAKAHALYTDLGASTWVVSFVANRPFLGNMTTEGDGYYELTNSAANIVPLFEDIAESLPLAIVE
jgi:hypothetical protein